AASRGDVEALRAQLVAGQDINVGSADKVTALMSAATSGNSLAVLFLLEGGADASARNEYRHSALDLAERMQAERIKEREGE
ncbi:hypothetical protein T484DRAFT_1577452, partial [Baffinella frigidus]